MRWVGAALIVTASAFWLSAAHPDELYSAYSEVRRWASAAGPLPSMPIPKPLASAPCPDQTATRIGPDQYFPQGVLGCGERLDAFLTEWYSKHLKALGEPALWALSRSDSEARVYRFLWLRSFHKPIAVRVIINPDLTGVVYVKVANGKGGYEPGLLVRNERLPVGKHGTTLLLTRIIETKFWDLQTRGQPGGFDGATWIVEAVTDGKYQVVERWSPAEADPTYTLGMTFLADLAGIRVSSEELY